MQSPTQMPPLFERENEAEAKITNSRAVLAVKQAEVFELGKTKKREAEADAIFVKLEAEAISNIKFDKVVIWENGDSNGQTNTSNFLQGMSRTLPPMLQVMNDIGGIKVPEAIAKLTGVPSNNGSTPDKFVPTATAETNADETPDLELPDLVASETQTGDKITEEA